MLAHARLQTLVLSSDLERSQRFYSDILELPLKGRSHGALVYDVGGGDLRVSPVVSTSSSEHTVLGFSVADIEAVVARLVDRGLQFERFADFPHDARGLVTLADGAKVAWFRDPDGALLSVVQYGGGG